MFIISMEELLLYIYNTILDHLSKHMNKRFMDLIP